MDGGEKWFNQVFQEGQDFKTVAVKAKMYELMRMWLLGTWIARNHRKKFLLLNLVLDSREQNIEALITPKIFADNLNGFTRLSWEKLYRNFEAVSDERIRRYFMQKAYYKNGRLVPVFDV